MLRLFKTLRKKTKIKSALLLFPSFVAVPPCLFAADNATTLSDVVVSEQSEDGRPETPSKTDFATPKTKVTKAAI